MEKINLSAYNEESNPDAFIDLSVEFDQQTEACKEYIMKKTNATELLPVVCDDVHNRASKRHYVFEEGFIVEFQQTYANDYSWEVLEDTVNKIAKMIDYEI